MKCIPTINIQEDGQKETQTKYEMHTNINIQKHGQKDTQTNYEMHTNNKYTERRTEGNTDKLRNAYKQLTYRKTDRMTRRQK